MTPRGDEQIMCCLEWPAARGAACGRTDGGALQVLEVTDMAGVRYEFRVNGLMSERAREAFSGMSVQPVPPESIICAEVVDEAHLRDILALCGALGLELVSLQQLPAAGGSVTRDEEGSGTT
jgi:hypothetical protein